jgi:tRNA-specific 2-thiouridylase
VKTSWCSGSAPDVSESVTVKTRYRAPDGACRLLSLEEHAMRLGFPEPQWAATPGQSAVLYQGEVCLGGGFIDAVRK